MLITNNPNLLLTIPVYRMVLEPCSFLYESNLGRSILDLIRELPNIDQANHALELKGKDEAGQIKYYNKQLILSMKSLGRNLLRRVNRLNDMSNNTLLQNDVEPLLEIFEVNRLEFLRWLVLQHIDEYRLQTRYLIDEVKNATSDEEILAQLRKNRVIKPLVHHLQINLNLYI